MDAAGPHVLGEDAAWPGLTEGVLQSSVTCGQGSVPSASSFLMSPEGHMVRD